MGEFMLAIGIALSIVGILCLYLGPKRVTTTVVNKVEHEYKASTDYDRLYDLLMEGRSIILLNNCLDISAFVTNYPAIPSWILVNCS